MANLAPADAVVAADGSGSYTTVAAAIAAAPSNNEKKYIIHVKGGIYKEFLVMGQERGTWCSSATAWMPPSSLVAAAAPTDSAHETAVLSESGPFVFILDLTFEYVASYLVVFLLHLLLFIKFYS
ncbi:unnamed protein product [Urochloa humidicola]